MILPLSTSHENTYFFLSLLRLRSRLTFVCAPDISNRVQSDLCSRFHPGNLTSYDGHLQDISDKLEVRGI